MNALASGLRSLSAANALPPCAGITASSDFMNGLCSNTPPVVSAPSTTCPLFGEQKNCTTWDGVIFNSAGEYVGGNIVESAYCNSLGSWFNDPTCHIPSTAEVRQRSVLELDTTSAPQAAKDAAIAAGDAAVAADCAARPGACEQQDAASKCGSLASLVGPQAASIFCAPNGTYTVWLAVAALVGVVLLVKK